MIKSVKVKNLSLSNDNVRKRGREVGLEELAASIAANGLLQNLVVTPLKKAGTFTVKAGGRRLRAIQLLIGRGALAADHEVPVLVLSVDDAASVGASLAENRQRVPMNPADDCLAFKHLIDQLGMTVEQVAIQQAVTVRFVEQRMRLAATHVPYDVERQLHEFHTVARPLTDEEQARIEALGLENDALIEALETDLAEGTPEANAANDRVETIEREIAEIDTARKTIDPGVKANLGTFVYIGGDGEARVHTRLFSEKPLADPRAGGAASGNGAGPGETGSGDDAVADPSPRLSATLIEELATQRRQILVAHVASDPMIALDLTIFLMAQSLVFTTSYVRDHSTLRADPAQFPIFAFRDEASMASQTIEDQRQHLDTTWVGHTTMSERFDAFRTLPDDARGAWVAFAVAQTLEATLNVADGARANGFHDHLGRLLDIQVACLWRPTAENYFGRVKKDVMLDALEEIGGPILRGRYKDAKKGELATTCAALCNGQGIVEAEIREKATVWLPEAMRFDNVERPERVPFAHVDDLQTGRCSRR